MSREKRLLMCCARGSCLRRGKSESRSNEERARGLHDGRRWEGAEDAEDAEDVEEKAAR